MKAKNTVYVILWCLGYTFIQGVFASFCADKADGNYPDPERCVGYIACSGTITHKMPCPAGLHYNKNGDYCDWPRNLKPQCKPGKPADPCDKKNGGCSHTCSNVGGTAKCSCKSGFKLESDLKTCTKVTGNWGAWSAYGKCTVTCGGGVQERSRLCAIAPQNGALCINADGTDTLVDVESKSCNTNECDKGLPPPPPPSICGKIKESNIGEVVGGSNALPNKWVWQGALYYDDQFLCGGSLIQPDTFLTAAHCVSNRDKSLMYVRMGDHKRSEIEPTEQALPVDKMIVHEGWNWATIANDIAILKFKKAFQLNDNVGTVCLPKATPPKDAKCYITGWGKTGANDDAADILQEAEMPIVPIKECRERNINKMGISKVTEDMLCAGFQGPDSKVSGCRGDSGGPLVCKGKDQDTWVIHGVVSWGSGRCDPLHRYTVFTKVTKYINWIDIHSFPEP